MFIRQVVRHAYRLDNRSPELIRQAVGFFAYSNSSIGVATPHLGQGNAFCAGECLEKSLPSKRKISPAEAFDSLQGIILHGDGSNTHIYYMDVLGKNVARYVDNVSIYLEAGGGANHSRRDTTPYSSSGPLRILRTPNNMDERHSDSDIVGDKISENYYDYPFRARHRASCGEIYILHPIPVSLISYGGYGGDALNGRAMGDWTPM